MLRKSQARPQHRDDDAKTCAPSRTHHAVGRWSPRGLPDLAHRRSRTCTCMPSLGCVPTATADQVSTRWFSKAPKPDPDRSRGAPCRRWTQRCSQAIRLELENPVVDHTIYLILNRSQARGRRAQTRQHTPPAPAAQPRSHAQAPAKDDPQRRHTGTGAHGAGASSLRARRAGQRRITSRQ